MRDRLRRIPRHFVMMGIMVIIYIPIAWVILNSFKSSKEILLNPFSIFFSPSFDNYIKAWNEVGLGSGFINSILLTVVSVFLIVLFSGMVAYVIAKKRFFGKKVIYLLFISGLMLPTFLAMAPLFNLMNDLKLLNTHLGLILVYTAYSLPFTIFMLVPFFEQVPSALEEAAIIDGVSQWNLFSKIYLPLAKPGLVTAAIFNLVGIWNEYILALILVTKEPMKTLPVKLANLMMIQQYRTDWGALYAGIVLSFIPVVIFFILFQKQLIEGSISGAVKE